MLFLFYGTDTIAVRQQALQKTAEYNKAPTRLESDQYEVGQIVSLVGSASLFGGQHVYLIDTPSQNKDMYEEVMSVLEVMAGSSDVFVVIEGGLMAPAKKVWAKYATVCVESAQPTAARFNAFAMADALANKDKKSLWLLFCEAKRNGLSGEEIIGTLWWQLKSLRLAAMTNSASEAGMKDFTYNKAKRALRNFRDGELETLSHSLLLAYHDGHGGIRDIDYALEEWVLGL